MGPCFRRDDINGVIDQREINARTFSLDKKPAPNAGAGSIGKGSLAYFIST